VEADVFRSISVSSSRLPSTRFTFVVIVVVLLLFFIVAGMGPRLTLILWWLDTGSWVGDNRC
jgi:hypothetical protein